MSQVENKAAETAGQAPQAESRIGKQPIPLPRGTEAKIDGNRITVKGPKGELSLEHLPQVEIELSD